MASSKSSAKASMRQKRRPSLSLNLSSFSFSYGNSLRKQRPDEPRAAVSAGVERLPASVSASSSSVGSDQFVIDEKPLNHRRQSWMLQRRQTAMGILQTMIPSLTLSPPLDRTHDMTLRRKSFSNGGPPQLDLSLDTDSGMPQHSTPPEPLLPPPPPPPSSAKGAPQLPPVEGLPPLEPPPKHTEHQSRRSSIPNVLRKIHKAATIPLQDHAHPPAQNNTPIPPVPTVIEAETSPTTLKKTRGGQRQSSLDQHDGGLQPGRRAVSGLVPSASPDSRQRSSSAHVGLNSGREIRTPSGSSLAPRSDSGDVAAASESRGRLRRSWLPGSGGRSRAGSLDVPQSQEKPAWIMTPEGTADYNTSSLSNGEKVPELWNDNGTVNVYLYPKGTGHGPSFKVPDHVFRESRVLNQLLLQEAIAISQDEDAQEASNATLSPPTAPTPGEGHLYVPLVNTELDQLVAARNLFAFLTGQPLVGIKAHPSLFQAFLQIAGLLKHLGFTNYDGSHFGDTVEACFEACIDQFNLADVRFSREKTIEALILGEQMKSWTLYNEGFTHAVGKYDDLLELNSPLFQSVSPNTRNRLERAHLDLDNRLANAKSRLESFEFPGVFAGVASSTSMDEYKTVRFKEWKNGFLRMRGFVLSYYKDLLGNWPPKARSKRNNFSHSGLNRICLKMLYSDLCALYDLLVDRDSLTPRGIDQRLEDIHEDNVDPNISALRKVLDEFDRSSPPVLPPIPYDVPKLPSMTAIREDYNQLSAKKQAVFDKGLAQHELLLILIKSHNIDIESLKIPFLSAFKEFELSQAKGTHVNDMADQRIGTWLFLYVVIQSLPMLIVDAPGLHFSEGAEYFLCEPPQGNLPWMDDAGEVRKMWYQTAGQGIVELSADVVMFSVEATYMRSHCWLAAKAWESAAAGSGTGTPSTTNIPQISAIPPALDPLEPPRSVFQDMDPGSASQGSLQGSPQLLPVHGRNASPAGRASAMADHFHRSSMAMGLEPLPFPESGAGGERRGSSRPGSSSGLASRLSLGPRSFSVTNLGQLTPQSGAEMSPPVPPLPHQNSEASTGGSTFDDILKSMDKGQGKPKPKKRFGF